MFYLLSFYFSGLYSETMILRMRFLDPLCYLAENEQKIMN
jgi:hypothetical protein